jgi:UDP-glucose 4-epimerase
MFPTTRSFDLVIHCAASYSDPLKWHRDTQTNIQGTINTVIKAKAWGARLIYFQTALPPISSYAISKIAGEQYIGLSDVPHTIFRLANIYGPRNLSGPIPTFYKRLSVGQPCTVVDTTRDMVYVDDLVNGVMWTVNNPDKSRKYDMCSGQHRPIRELYDAVHVATLGDETWLAAAEVPAGGDDVHKMKLDPAPVALDTGWVATTDLSDGVRAAVEWYDNNEVRETYTHLSMKG